MPERISDELLAAIGTNRNAAGIAAALHRMIRAGDVAVGERLPTVRALAGELGVSPTTVSEAWQSLASAGAIEARGRNGTVVLGPVDPVRGPRRYRGVTGRPGRFAMDLSTGTPEPSLLPDLSRALANVAARQRPVVSYSDDAVLPELAAVLRDAWPFEAEAITVVDGAMDALDRIATHLVRVGDVVLVETPTFPPLLDLLEQLGAHVVGVEQDHEGMCVDSLAIGLQQQPVALFTQPRAQNPTGISLSRERRDALLALLESSVCVVVEDDHCGALATSPLQSFGEVLPRRTVHIRGFSKSHGPDLRLAALGGAASIVDAIASRRLLGPSWSSRLLQAVLYELLIDPATEASIATAASVYASRRAQLLERGIASGSHDGINVWIHVPDANDAVLACAARGIGIAPGFPFFVDNGLSRANVQPSGASRAEFVRLTLAPWPDDYEARLDDLAEALRAGPIDSRPQR